MTPGVVVLVLFVAVLHVAWNVVLKTSGDPLRTSARAMVVGVGVGLPPAIVAWLALGRPGVPTEALVLGLASGVVETAYFVCLAAAYERGDLSIVYPLARGTAPLLAVAVGVLVLGERLEPIGYVGVVVLLAGILAIQRPWRVLAALRARASGTGPLVTNAAAGFAVLTGVMIAAYSAIDRVGTRLVPPWLYASILFPVCAVTLVAWVRFVADREPRDVRGPGPATWTRAGVAGTISLAAYLLILVAYTLAPLTAVAPLRESAVVFASAWGALRLGEAASRFERFMRLSGAGFVLVGAVLLALSR